MTYYAILPIDKLHLPDWSQLDQDRDTARKDNSGNNILVSFLKAYKGDFETITLCESFTINEIEVILNTADWLAEDDLDLE